MRAPDLDRILSAMLRTYDGISDLNFSVGHPLQVEDFGELKPVFVDPPIERLTPYQTEQLALTLMQGNRRLMHEYLVNGSCDCSYAIAGEARFRVNIFRQRGHCTIVMRKLQSEIPSLQSLNLPEIFSEIAKEKTGLVLVTGATGSGKTTTLAALLNEINQTQAVHIVTLEDPIEFVHPIGRATFNQRELGHDFDNYPNGLRAALRQAPKVILVGEMRDRATVEVALMAAETGHLVVSTLHTVDAGHAIHRILGLFSLGEESQLRLRLANTIRYIVSQRLAPKIGGGRQLLECPQQSVPMLLPSDVCPLIVDTWEQLAYVEPDWHIGRRSVQRIDPQPVGAQPDGAPGAFEHLLGGGPPGLPHRPDRRAQAGPRARVGHVWP